MLGFFYSLANMPSSTIDTCPPFLRMDKHGNVILDIQVMPNAPRTTVDGLCGEPGQQALKVRLHAPPVGGKANDALLKWLADTLGIPRHSFEMVRGKTARRKQLRLLCEAATKADWTRLARHL